MSVTRPNEIMSQKTIHLIDTAIASDNIGDEIIVEACRDALSNILCDAYVTTSSSHDGLGPSGRKLVAASDLVFLLGTNALSAKSAKWRKPFNWHVTHADLPALDGKVILFGVGAHRAFSAVKLMQRRFLRRVLSKRYSHSVRDASALAMLEACELQGANTACPTLWRWRDKQPQTNHDKAREVCFSLTSHKVDPHNDRLMIDILKSTYDHLWFWPQQQGDIPYLRSLDRDNGVSIIPPNLASYDDILRSRSVDVIGTRLHGTIRGLMHGRRSIVIAIDNRANELGEATGLPMVRRPDIEMRLRTFASASWETRLRINAFECERFLGQFRAHRVPGDSILSAEHPTASNRSAATLSS
jgi:hypothetical protein